MKELAGDSTSTVVLTSSDGGVKWVRQVIPGNVAGLTAISCPTSEMCMAAGQSESDGVRVPTAILTEDGGSIWTQLTLPPSASAPSAISCANTENCVMTEIKGQILSTENAGESWTLDSLPADILSLSAVSCVDDTDCYAVGVGEANQIYAAILATTNAGQTWTLESAPSGEDSLDGISCRSATACVAVADGAYPVISTTDGSTWGADTLPGLDEFGVYGVSCVSTTCVAAGADETGGVMLQETS